MEMEDSFGRMVESMRAAGIEVNRAASDTTSTNMASKEKVSGLMEGASAGSTRTTLRSEAKTISIISTHNTSIL